MINVDTASYLFYDTRAYPIESWELRVERWEMREVRVENFSQGVLEILGMLGKLGKLGILEVLGKLEILGV